MSNTRIRPGVDIRTVDTFDDTKPAGPTLEDPNGSLEDLIQAMLSQLRRILDASGGGNWFDAIAAVNAKTRALLQLNTDLDDLEEKRLLFVTSDLVDVAVADGSNAAILSLAQVPQALSSVAAVDGGTTLGTVVASHPGTFGDHSLAEVAGKNAVSPKNFVIVIDGETGTPIISDNDKPVIALLQSENATDGHTMSGTTPNRLQVSFVRVNDTEDDLEAAPVDDFSGGKTIKFSYVVRTRLDDLPEDAFLGGAIFSGAGGGGVGGGSGSLYITDIEVPGGTATGKFWQDPVGKTVLQKVVVSSVNIELVVRSAYPIVEFEDTLYELVRDPVGGFYEGNIPATLAGPGELEVTAQTPDDKTGAKDTVEITAIDAPPNVTSVLYSGDYPDGPSAGNPPTVETQTELPEDDEFDLVVQTDKNMDLIEILLFGASKFRSIVVPVGQSATIQIRARDLGDSPQLLPARVRVRDAGTGAFSATADTNGGGGTTEKVHLVKVNDLRPTDGAFTVDYPAGQNAIKDAEQATVNHEANDADETEYNDPTSPDQIVIANPFTFEAAKLVTGNNPGIFNDSVDNFEWKMTRRANGTQLTRTGRVTIADVVPIIDVGLPFTRLRSGGLDGTLVQDYLVTITSDQPLIEAPVLLPEAGGNKGVFITPFTGGPLVWTATFRVNENLPDQKGTFTFTGLQAKGLAGLVQTSINTGAQYTLGGFVKRDPIFGPGQTTAIINVPVSDFSKLQGGLWQATNQQSIKFAIGTSVPPPVGGLQDGYTIDGINLNPTTVIWLDLLAASSNTGNAALFDLEETV